MNQYEAEFSTWMNETYICRPTADTFEQAQGLAQTLLEIGVADPQRFELVALRKVSI